MEQGMSTGTEPGCYLGVTPVRGSRKMVVSALRRRCPVSETRRYDADPLQRGLYEDVSLGVMPP